MWAVTILVAIAFPLQIQDEGKLVEALRAAQATHRDAWNRGRADVRVEILNPKVDKPAVIEGQVTWLDSSSILKYKVSDLGGAFFRDRGVSLDQEWNYISKTPDFVITYQARRNVFSDRKPGPLVVQPYYELSPRTAFTNCCPPSLAATLPFDRQIGPVANTPPEFKESDYTHQTFGNGDIEQTRLDKSGHRTVILFSNADDLAVRRLKLLDPNDHVLESIDYTYARDSGHRLVPATCIYQAHSPAVKISSWKYIYTNVKIPGSVSAAEFRRDSVVALIRRTTPYGKSTAQRQNHEASDEVLDALSKDLRKSQSNKPD